MWFRVTQFFKNKNNKIYIYFYIYYKIIKSGNFFLFFQPLFKGFFIQNISKTL
jgi:hypothetical protein